MLIYDRSLDDDPELVEAVGAAVTIALENRRLHAEAAARLAELQASRERIITASDAERRRHRRNLHDGAQQRLVTLALQLSLMQRRIRRDPADAEQLASRERRAGPSLAELRELARGIHPAALEQAWVALEALAPAVAGADAGVADDGPRLPEPVEFAAYFVASEALANVAKHAQASAVTIRLRPHGDGRRRRDRRRRGRRRRPHAGHRSAGSHRPGGGPRRAARGVSSPIEGGGQHVVVDR